MKVKNSGQNLMSTYDLVIIDITDEGTVLITSVRGDGIPWFGGES